jgi:hypothetical protein
MPARAEPAPPRDPPGDIFPPARLGAALFLLSTATVLFTLAIFKLLSFFIMPSLFFDLLFVGFPIGAFLGARFFRSNAASFRATLWILQGAMVASVIAALFCKHFDYLRAHLFEVRLHRLLAQMGTFTAFFIPFFCAYGLSEYLGYQIGRRTLKGRMPLVYALYLFGAAGAYLFLRYLLPWFEVSRVLCLALGLIACASALLSPRGARRAVLALECAVLFVLATPWQLAFPQAAWADAVEAAFLRQYKGSSPGSTAAYAKDGYTFAFQEWGDYSLTEVMAKKPSSAGGLSPSAPGEQAIDHFAGFYNDLFQWEYAPGHGFTERSLGMVPIDIAPRGGRIAIIGAGGGRQVRWALEPRYAFTEIVALEIEPAVFRAVREELREEFGGVYERPNVRPLRAEARGFMERTEETFDLIYMPSVGGYPQMMLEPGNMIRTIDAYVTLRDRLSPRGILAIWYPGGLDPKNILTEQYVRTLESPRVGLKTRAYFNTEEFLILAARDPQARLPTCGEIDALLLENPRDERDLPPNPAARCGPFAVLPDPDFTPITDEQPFLAGNVRHIFSIEQVYVLFGISAALLAAIGAAIVAALRRRGDPRIPGRSYGQVAGLSLLIGANFLVFEHFVILALFKKLYVFHDALVLGAISFLVLSGLGSVLVTRRRLPYFQALGAVFVLALVVLEGLERFGVELHLPAVAVAALAAPVAFVTGSFFPALFEEAAHNPLAVFAMDALGAALGSMAAFFVPIVFGFHVFFAFGALLFFATCAATGLFFRQRARPIIELVPASPFPDPTHG